MILSARLQTCQKDFVSRAVGVELGELDEDVRAVLHENKLLPVGPPLAVRTQATRVFQPDKLSVDVTKQPGVKPERQEVESCSWDDHLFAIASPGREDILKAVTIDVLPH